MDQSARVHQIQNRSRRVREKELAEEVVVHHETSEGGQMAAVVVVGWTQVEAVVGRPEK